MCKIGRFVFKSEKLILKIIRGEQHETENDKIQNGKRNTSIEIDRYSEDVQGIMKIDGSSK